MTQPIFQSESQSEQDRIRAVYRAWHGGKPIPEYAWHRPEIFDQAAAQNRVIGQMLAATVGHDLTDIRALDVGCGSGRFVHELIDWGATPSNLAGTEYQEDRLDRARQRTAPGVLWHLGDL